MVSSFVKKEQYNNDRMLGLSSRVEEITIIFNNVYFSHPTHHNDELVIAYNEKLED